MKSECGKKKILATEHLLAHSIVMRESEFNLPDKFSNHGQGIH